MKLYAVIGTITPGCGVYIHLYGLHTDRKAAERRRAEVEAAARRANKGEIEDVAPRLVKVVEADKDGVSHRPGACSILPTVWGAPGVPAGTIVRCWNQRYGVANMLREKGEDGLADEMAYLGRFD